MRSYRKFCNDQALGKIQSQHCRNFSLRFACIKCYDGDLTNLTVVGTQLMFGSLDVKGDATDASASDKEIPACAVFRAPQSLAPSPHIPT